MQTAITLNSVRKTYNSREVLKGLSAELPKGRFIVLLGKNGAGKSTLLRAIAGFEAIDDGQIVVLGSDLEEENLARRQSTAFVSEMIEIGLNRTLEKVAEFAASFHPKWDQAVFDKFFSLFGLPRDGMFSGLSRGQRIQFLFSMAAAQKPDLYLLDEVTSVLDAHARYQTMAHLKSEVDRGATVILATNIATETQGFGNHVIFVDDGLMKLNCATSELTSRFAKFKVPRQELQKITSIKTARPVYLNPDDTISYLLPVETNVSISELTPYADRRAITIEDLFVYYTGPESHV